MVAKKNTPIDLPRLISAYGEALEHGGLLSEIEEAASNLEEEALARKEPDE